MTEKTKHDSLIEALVAAQSEMGHATRNCENKMFGGTPYRYADLPSVLDAVLPPLNRHGIALVQMVSGDGGQTISVSTSLRFGGEVLDGGSMTMPISASGGKGNINHAAASAVTYARRVTIQAITGISSDEDNDGNASAPPGEDPHRTPRPDKVPRDWVATLKGVLREEIKAEGRKEVEACIRYATDYRLGVEDVAAHAKEILAALDAAKKDGGGSFAGFKNTAINQWNKE